MAKDLNRVQCTGYLGADPELRSTAQGTIITTFRVASGRVYRDGDGERHEETEWFRVVAWDRLAEICAELLSKGSRVYIEGRLQTRRWTDQSGQERTTVEVVAQDMILLSSRAGELSPDAAVSDTDVTTEEASEPVVAQDPESTPEPVAKRRSQRRPTAVEATPL
jgi:single-strand DNA-binding protein